VKKILFISLIFCFALPVFPAEKIQVISNGDLKGFYRIRVYNDIKYFSLKDISNVCSGGINWYKISGKVVFTLNTHHITFYLKSKDVLIDSNKYTLPFPTYMVSSDLYIPLDFFLSIKFAEASGHRVEYDPEQNILSFESAVNVYPPRVYSFEGFTQINFEMTEKLAYDIQKKAKNDYQVVFFRGKTVTDKLYFQNDHIKNISISNAHNQAMCRFKLTDGKLEIKPSYLENPLRLVLNISPPGVEVSTSGSEGLAIAGSTVPVAAVVIPKPEEKIQTIPAAGMPAKALTIVVDAGHGGDDPGAVGPNNSREKDINLAIAKGVAKLLSRDGYKIILTRQDDTFIPLVDRTQIANENNANFFVSIHCNSNSKKKQQGFEIYFLSENASDPDASAVVARENAVVKLEGNPTVKKEKIQTLLWAMVMNEYMNESSELCSYITEDVTSRIKINNRGIKQAGFYVLRGAQMPAVLIECAFLSNPKEEIKLRTRKFQKDMADSIYAGIKKYIYKKNLDR